MITYLKKLNLENWRNFFLFTLVISIPFTIVGGEFSIFGIYLITILLFIKRQETWQNSIVFVGMIILFIGYFISTCLAEDVIDSLEYLRSFWRFGLPFAVFFALRNQNEERFLKVLLAIATVICLYGIGQYFTGIDILRTGQFAQNEDLIDGSWHAIGSFSHHLTYGGVFLIVFALFLAPAFSASFSLKERSVYLIASLIMFVSLILSMGRSSYLGMAAGIVYILMFRKPKLMITLTIIGIITVTTLYVQRNSWIEKATKFRHPITDRIVRLFDENQSLDSDRVNMWKAGTRILSDHFIEGIGGNNAPTMQPYYDEVQKETGQPFQHGPATGIHNIYLQTWINLGIIGFLGYLVIWLGLIIQSARSVYKNTSGSREAVFLIGATAGLAGSMVAGFFENNFRDGEVQITIFFVMGLALALAYKIRNALPEITK